MSDENEILHEQLCHIAGSTKRALAADAVSVVAALPGDRMVKHTHEGGRAEDSEFVLLKSAFVMTFVEHYCNHHDLVPSERGSEILAEFNEALSDFLTIYLDRVPDKRTKAH